MNTKVNFKVFYKTKKIANYCTTKDPTTDELKSHVIYCFECPGCKTQGCLYLLDVKFKAFSMTFQDLFKQIQDLFKQIQDLFKQIQDLLNQLKPKSLTHYFQNKLYYSASLNWLILTMKNNQ